MMTTQPRVIWGSDVWAETDGWASAHCADTATSEYIGPLDVWVSAGTGLPAGAYLDAPPAKEDGKAIVRTGEGWSLLADHRGETAYHKQTGAKTVIAEIGELPATVTLLAPQSQFDVWDEPTGEWVTDAAAEQQSLNAQATQQKTALLSEATAMIAPLQDAVDMGMATPEEETALLDWKFYRVMLTRVDVAAHPVTWPAHP